MPGKRSFDYAIIRVVPHVERGEFINAGAIVFSRELRFLAAKVELDVAALHALSPDADVPAIERHLAIFPLLCEGGAAAGPIGALSQAERFHWLTAPRSTVIQTSPVHSGCTDDPAAELEKLLREMVRRPR